MSKTALDTILLRNAFYRDGYKRVVFCLLLVIVVDALLLFGCIYRVAHPAQPQYFATTPDGRLIMMHPLSDPVLTDEEVLQWVSVAVRKVYAIDYIHWRDQLQSGSQYFTTSGWNYFLSALKSSNNLDTVTKLKMVASAEITGSPEVVQKTVVDNHYAWKITVPILLSYNSPARSRITQSVLLTLIVLRMPVQNYPSRVAINNLFSSTSGVAGAGTDS